MLWVSDVLVFKGEEKKDHRESNVAKQELLSKMTTGWVRDLQTVGVRTFPFMFAYAAAGGLMQFYVVHR